jgi:hypothetical protein
MTEDKLPLGVRSVYKDLDTLIDRYSNIEGNVDMLVRDTMVMLGFDRIDPRVNIVSGHTLTLNISGKNVNITPDIMVEYKERGRKEGILIIHEDKNADTQQALHDALPQLVAEALAMFVFNRKSLPFMDKQDIYGVISMGTLPTFYKIPVTSKLIDSIAAGNTVSPRTTLCNIKWCGPVDDDNYGIASKLLHVATDSEYFSRYLEAYEALRLLVTSILTVLKEELARSDEDIMELTSADEE